MASSLIKNIKKKTHSYSNDPNRGKMADTVGVLSSSKPKQGHIKNTAKKSKSTDLFTLFRTMGASR